MVGVVPREEERAAVREFFELFKTPWEFWRPGGRYEVVVRADDGCEHGSARAVVVYGGRATRFDEKARCLPGPGRVNATLNWNGEQIPVHGSCVTFPQGGGSPRLRLADGKESVAAMTRTDASTFVRIGYDLFHEVRFLLTTGQPAAHAGIATLERHIGVLREAILLAGVPLVEIPPVPEGHRFIACLTHDIDHPAIRRHRFDQTMFGFLYRAIIRTLIEVCRGRTPARTLWRNWASAATLPFVYLGLAQDFWSQFDRYLEIEEGLGSTFFVIPVKGYPGRVASGAAPRLRASSYGVDDITDQLKLLRVAGCEVALHGIDAWCDGAAGSEERARVTRVTGASVAGVRMHWLFVDERTPELLERAGFVYDSTFGYNETVGFRAGTMQAFRPLVAERLLELPLAIMDTALFYPKHLNLTAEAARDTVWRLVDDAERYGGALTINWHDRSLGPERLWGEFYVELVAELKRRAAWFPTAAQAAEWFAQRRSVVFESAHWEGGWVRIKASAPRSQDLPGMTLRVHTPASRDDGLSERRHRPRAFTDIPFGSGVFDTTVALGDT
jgi:hypothetical protein